MVTQAVKNNGIQTKHKYREAKAKTAYQFLKMQN